MPAKIAPATGQQRGFRHILALVEPEAYERGGEDASPRPFLAADAEPTTLYVHRPLTNADDIIRWAHDNVDAWLKKHNPETALIMFGTNDLHDLDAPEYAKRLRAVVRKCLDNGTVVILSTIPPRHGYEEKSAAFSAAVREIALELKAPLTDYHAEILRRRPTDKPSAVPSGCTIS